MKKSRLFLAGLSLFAVIFILFLSMGFQGNQKSVNQTLLSMNEGRINTFSVDSPDTDYDDEPAEEGEGEGDDSSSDEDGDY